MAGIVGVSNIMLITVRERYARIRNTQSDRRQTFINLALIIFESIMVTAAFGFWHDGRYRVDRSNKYGMRKWHKPPHRAEEIWERFLRLSKPDRPLGYFNGSNFIIHHRRCIGRYFPARKAVKVSAVEAMRHE
jgi:putative ABC transport system permease protein